MIPPPKFSHKAEIHIVSYEFHHMEVRDTNVIQILLYFNLNCRTRYLTLFFVFDLRHMICRISYQGYFRIFWRKYINLCAFIACLCIAKTSFFRFYHTTKQEENYCFKDFHNFNNANNRVL